MIHFKNFELLWEDLEKNVKAKKDVYVFDSAPDGYDFCKEETDDSIDYYVHPLIDIDKLQRQIIREANEGNLYKNASKELGTWFDYTYDDGILWKRLYIFHID